MRTPPPALVLAVALVLTGAGQVLNREPVRGLVFAFFALLLGTFTLVTADPDVSWVGYANAALQAGIEPLLQAALRARGLL